MTKILFPAGTFPRGMQVEIQMVVPGNEEETRNRRIVFDCPTAASLSGWVEGAEDGSVIVRVVGGKLPLPPSFLKPTEPQYKHAGCEHCVFLGRIEADSPGRYAQADQNRRDGTGEPPARKTCSYDLYYCSVSGSEGRLQSVMARFGNQAEDDYRDRLPLGTGPRVPEVLWQAQRLAQIRELWGPGGRDGDGLRRLAEASAQKKRT